MLLYSLNCREKQILKIQKFRNLSKYAVCNDKKLRFIK